MSNPSGPDQSDDVTSEVAEAADDVATDEAEPPNRASLRRPTRDPTRHRGDGARDPQHEPVTEIMAPAEPSTEASEVQQPAERRFTAPSGFDAGSTQQIDTPAEPATEVFRRSDRRQTRNPLHHKLIPPRGEVPKPRSSRRSWGWVIALLLVIAALVAVAVLGTVLLTRNSEPKISQDDKVRSTIQNFDIAIQNGDLATLRTITCGATRDSYVNYNDRSWAETHARVAAAKQYPVVASIDQVVVNGDHAEANVTTFMAYAPQTRSTRSFDLQFRDDQWKICQAPSS